MVDELILQDGGTVVAIAPERGAIVTRFDVGPRRVLYLDETTLHDPTKNVRGGVPVLFPTPGKLADDAWSYAGHAGTLKQHGFARDLPWQVCERTASSVRLRLATSPETRARWPWELTFDLTCSVAGATLRLDQRIDNTGEAAMPIGVGFHPYFAVPDADKPRTTIATGARRAFDNVTKRDVDLDGPLALARPEVDLHLLDHGSSESALVAPGGTVTLRGSAEYTHWVVWTIAGKDYVCLEPWTCPGNALNTGDRLIVLAPGETRTLWLEITAG
jgi:galactose mutarotase-like enzyme